MVGNEFVVRLFERMIWLPMIGPSTLTLFPNSTALVPIKPPCHRSPLSNWMLSPGLFCPPLPFATIMKRSALGSQPAKLHVLARTYAHIEPVMWNVPERYRDRKSVV